MSSEFRQVRIPGIHALLSLRISFTSSMALTNELVECRDKDQWLSIIALSSMLDLTVQFLEDSWNHGMQSDERATSAFPLFTSSCSHEILVSARMGVGGKSRYQDGTTLASHVGGGWKLSGMCAFI